MSTKDKRPKTNTLEKPEISSPVETPVEPVDWNALLSAADEADKIGETIEPEKKARKKKVASLVKTPTEEPVKAVEPEVIKADPEFQAMIQHGTDKGLDWIRDSMNLVEPGPTVRSKTGEGLVRLIERIKPMEPGPLADVVMIVGYLGVWVLMGQKEKEAPAP